MRKIGFIDHYLNNFHANCYLEMIREARHAKDFEVCYAYGEVPYEGVNSAEWCKRNGVQLLDSPAEVAAKSDNVIVLSPNNPERHMALSEDALKSGKSIYIDKTFALDYKMAEKMIATALEYDTPMFTTSAFRFVPEIQDYINGLKKERLPRAVAIRGARSFEVYGVHHIEPLVMMLGQGAQSVCYIGDGDFMSFTISYPDARFGSITQYRVTCNIGEKPYAHPFEASIMFDEGVFSMEFSTGDMFKSLVDSICSFFLGGPSPAPYGDTLEIMALIDAAARAKSNPGNWIDVPQRADLPISNLA